MGAGLRGYLVFMRLCCCELKVILKSCQGQGCFSRAVISFCFLPAVEPVPPLHLYVYLQMELRETLVPPPTGEV